MYLTSLDDNQNEIQMLESKLTDGDVFKEFETIPKKRLNADFKTASSIDNVSRNRFKDVLPYEENKVQLSPSKENKTGYINASHVTVTIGGMTRFYIAAQGPLPSTITSFWQMVWEQNVHLVVMLTHANETVSRADFCPPYWPLQDGTSLDFNEYRVERVCSTVSSSYTTHQLKISHLPSKKQRPLWHLQYTDWADHGQPSDTKGFISFLEEMDSVRRHAVSEIPVGRSRNVPVIVHCSAGVGRTGVTILCDILLYCLDHNQPIDVGKFLTHLREQRMLLVQTVSQYKFVYSLLLAYLKNSRLI